jgi:hypothetical protein
MEFRVNSTTPTSLPSTTGSNETAKPTRIGNIAENIITNASTSMAAKPSSFPSATVASRTQQPPNKPQNGNEDNRLELAKNVHEVSLSNGGIYRGEIKDGNADGHGVLKRQDGSIAYEGKWQDSIIHGRGTSFHPDGSIEHVGEWEKGRYIGLIYNIGR